MKLIYVFRLLFNSRSIKQLHNTLRKIIEEWELQKKKDQDEKQLKVEKTGCLIPTTNVGLDLLDL